MVMGCGANVDGAILGSLKMLCNALARRCAIWWRDCDFWLGMGGACCYAINQPSIPDVATATITVGSMENRAAINRVAARAMSSCGLWEMKCGAITDSNTQAGAASSVRAMRGESVLFFNKKKPSKRVE